MIRFASLAVAAAILGLASTPATATAQRADSVRVGAALPREVSSTDSEPATQGLAVSPRRAFLTSLAVPGSMQLRLGRPKAAAIFLVAEAGSVGMSLKSWNDLRKAKAARRDTILVPVLDPSGNPVLDPETGEPVAVYEPRDRNLAGRVRARRAHLEDWVAVAVFNHFFSGADAYVAAHLSDFDANVGTSQSRRRVGISARLRW